MKERPLLFSGDMVRAILDGRKTQTRRLVKGPLDFLGGRGEESDPAKWGWFFDGPSHHGYMVLGRDLNEQHDHGSISIPCQFGDSGDRLWVRETFGLTLEHDDDDDGEPTGARHVVDPDGRTHWVVYRSDRPDWVWTDGDGYAGPSLWKPSIHMPRWASRLTLEIEQVRVERLHDISEEDAKAEGIVRVAGGWGLPDWTTGCGSARQAFQSLWEHINGDGSWDENPWVWVIMFRKVSP